MHARDDTYSCHSPHIILAAIFLILIFGNVILFFTIATVYRLKGTYLKASGVECFKNTFTQLEISLIEPIVFKQGDLGHGIVCD